MLGEVSQEELLKESNIARIDISELQFKTNIEDSLLRNFVEKEDRFNTLESAASKVEYVLFSPIQGQTLHHCLTQVKSTLALMFPPKQTLR